MQLDFLQAFLLTNAIEIPVCWLFLKKQQKPQRIVLATLLANTITLPFVWFVFPFFIHGYWIALALSEIFAFLSEAAIYAQAFRLKARQALLISFCANCPSFLIGLALACLA